jgi:hypothetical protein
MTEKLATDEQHTAYALHTLSCRTCWDDKSKCPTARQLDPWPQEAQR